MRLGAIVIDSDDPKGLAEFYKELLGWILEVQYSSGERWIIVKSPNGTNIETPLVFQYDENYERPTWPTKNLEQQQMLHLDFYVSADKYAEKIEHAISCGAIRSETQFSENWTVMLDPSEHPFCIIPIPEGGE